MQKTMFVVPAKGLRVLDPRTGQPIKADGQAVPRNTYWLRRLRAGEVTKQAETPVPVTTKKAKADK